MMRRCRSVGAHVRCARATQMQALDCPSLAVDRTKKNDLYIHCASLFFMQGSKGLERDVKKTARCAVFSPRRVNRVSGAKKGVRNACARRVAEQVPSTAPNKNKTNLDENSKFVLFFTRDYFGLKVKK